MDISEYITFSAASYGAHVRVELDPHFYEPRDSSRHAGPRRYLLKKSKAENPMVIEALRWRICERIKELCEVDWTAARDQIGAVGAGYLKHESGYLSKYTVSRDGGVAIGSGDIFLRNDASPLEQLAAVVTPTPDQYEAGRTFKGVSDKLQNHMFRRWRTTAALYTSFVYLGLAGEDCPPRIITINGRRYPVFGEFDNEFVAAYWPTPRLPPIELVTFDEESWVVEDSKKILL